LHRLEKVFIDIENNLKYYFNMNENYWKQRWSTDQQKAMLLEQFDTFWTRELGITRDRLCDIEKAAELPHAVIISGLRRVGKSTLLAQIAHKIGRDAFYYLNFEDDRFLGFQAEDANYLYQLLVELFGERKVFFIDEIQNVTNWEFFVRRFIEMGFKFYITGSNASLLSRELGTRLTGRYIPIELFPFSFREFLIFYNRPVPDLQRMSTKDKGYLNSVLNDYLRLGGIPDALKYPKLNLLRTLFDDVLYRDIATRYRIEAITALKELAFTLISNPTNLISYNKLKEQFRLGSVNTIKSYIDYMENSWLLFSQNIYDYSIKRQQIAAKKIYSIDSGLTTSIGFGFSPNTGKLLENSVFLSLRQLTSEIYYYTTPNNFEVDFYLPEQRQLFQVTLSLIAPSTREREMRALIEACKVLKVKQGTILSDENEDSLEIDGLKIDIRSTAEWLLSR